MQLAKKSASGNLKNDTVSLLKEAKTCKQAYLAVGMIPDEEKNTTDKAPPTFLSLLCDLRDSPQFKALAEESLDSFEEQDLRNLIDAFTPLIAVRDWIADTVSKKFREKFRE
jgi:hypothetical protein